ncbi:copper resistance CopC family protein [Micromonospora sp. CB01531]|uniref:copper resistance CopC family protein n=1 Tax=Micromonospora sp. CB01531 TaxID=1718947 RepID=UPI00093D8E08|nr:copper resistance CopC family protein [Micromonospora sp. CB01531]OKI47511.1 copper resistance protein CopC [Micromonospora sp. CB01531]
MPTRIRQLSCAGLVAAVLAAMAVLLAPATPAAAHNSLQAVNPAQDARLSTPPTQITLKFLQKLDPAFTTIVLSDAGQQKVPTSEPTVAGATGTVTISQPLANGNYTVAYRVVSADGHPVQGSYSFTVADPAASAPTASAAPSVAASAAGNGAASPASVSPAASSRRSDGSGQMLLVTGGIALVAVVAGAVLVLRRRRATS